MSGRLRHTAEHWARSASALVPGRPDPRSPRIRGSPVPTSPSTARALTCTVLSRGIFVCTYAMR
jgi:hypothetical protein